MFLVKVLLLSLIYAVYGFRDSDFQIKKRETFPHANFKPLLEEDAQSITTRGHNDRYQRYLHIVLQIEILPSSFWPTEDEEIF